MAKLFQPGGPSSGVVVQPVAGPAGLRVDVEDGPLSLPYAGLTHRLGGYEDAWLILETPGVPGVELWLEPSEAAAFAGPSGGVPPEARPRFESMVGSHTGAGLRRLVGRGLWVAAGLLVLVWFASGGFTDLVLGVVPPSVDVTLGEQMAEGVAADADVCDDPVLVGAIEEVLVRLVDKMPEQPYPFRVRVLRSPDVNAFATPGGELFIHSALLEHTESVDQVAAILGHETQHVTLRHGMRRVVRSAGIRVGLAVLLGDSGEVAAMLAGAAGNLTNLKFGRDEERDSDVQGVELMVRAGFAANGAVEVFELIGRLAGESGHAGEELLALAASHPTSSERSERLLGLAKTLRSSGRHGMQVDWPAVRGRCAPSDAS